jgi:hypothetical protein
VGHAFILCVAVDGGAELHGAVKFRHHAAADEQGVRVGQRGEALETNLGCFARGRYPAYRAAQHPVAQVERSLEALDAA